MATPPMSASENQGVDLHFREVIGNKEQGRGVETGRDRLAWVHIARDDYAIDRSVNGATGEIDDRIFQRCLAR